MSSNPLKKLRDLLNPQQAEYVGTITSVSHPNYKVLVADNSGLVLCTSNVVYALGAKVFISNGEIKRPAPAGSVTQIEI
ncbi:MULTISPECIES: hypothetical protein [Acinetobacter]|jgi:hypothetical protein|uniref:Uncharacterized protein n=2 Tax=Acinetobacter TaxID=469 RepID=A0A4Q7ANP8_9GAMM|nr:MULTISPECIES: hypothetical protein [Acinetobacter]MCW8041258.1 hypothetical protein [Acinetobacter entericus]RZG63564.1 hypothetical protein EXE25_19155 [Acinetobacter bouvetii]TCB76792.1 hypothetical protein E0H91_00570 [Acinetobacter sp. ANC 4177]